jgi:hypothetical protein
MEQKTADFQGKKIFILYPHSVIHEGMLDILIMEGYETYILRDHNRARKLLERFPDSIMFINIDEGLKEEDWDCYIREILRDPKTKDCRLGIMSYNADKDLMQKYLIDLSLPCGYVQLKLGIQESTRIILEVLGSIEARGRRKFIRADCTGDFNANLNYKEEDTLYRGKLLDISSAGFAAKIERFGDFPVNSLLRNVQMRLHSGLFMIDIVLMGRRQDKTDTYIFLFGGKLSPEHKLIIHRYIKLCLQKYVEGLDL